MKRTIVLAVLVATAAFIVGGIARATCSAPCGDLCLTGTYPLAVEEDPGLDPYHYNTIPIESNETTNVVITWISGESTNVTEVWVSGNGGSTWHNITETSKNIAVTSGVPKDFIFSSLADDDESRWECSGYASTDRREAPLARVADLRQLRPAPPPEGERFASG